MTALSPDPAPENRPVVRLLPKANARAIRHGMPWVYANEVVLDRRTKALAQTAALAHRPYRPFPGRTPHVIDVQESHMNDAVVRIQHAFMHHF